MTDYLTRDELLSDAWMQLGHAVNMVADLPLHLDGDLPRHVRHACSEAFAINANLVAQFVGDVDLIGVVDQHVVSFGRDRMDEPLAVFDIEAIKARLLTAILEDLHDHERLGPIIMDAFYRTEPMS